MKRWTIFLLGLLIVGAGWYVLASGPRPTQDSHPEIDASSREKLQRELERGD